MASFLSQRKTCFHVSTVYEILNELHQCLRPIVYRTACEFACGAISTFGAMVGRETENAGLIINFVLSIKPK